MGRLTGDVVAMEAHDAGADGDETEHRLEERRLAGAVGADDADELARGDGEVAAVEDVDLGHVAGDEIGGVDDAGGGGAATALIGRAPPTPQSVDLVRLGDLLERLDAEIVGVETELFDRLGLVNRPDVDVVVRPEVGVDDRLIAGDLGCCPLGDERPSAITRTQSLIS